MAAILLITNYPLDGQQSMWRAAGLIESGLRANGVEVLVAQPQPFFGLIGKILPRLGKWLAYLDKYLLFPIILMSRARRCLLVHIVDHSNAVYLFWLRSQKSIVTCNDLLAVRSARGEIPEHRTGFGGKLLQKWIRAGLRRATHIACISEATRLDVLRLTGKSEQEVSRIYLGLGPAFEAELERKLSSGVVLPPARRQGDPIVLREQCRSRGSATLPIPYILHVGGSTWYKNREGVLKIYVELRRRLGRESPNLILVGPPLESPIHGVCFLQNITDDLLVELYRNAALLLFPSLYEGFGWPVVEANACGCPALASRIDSLVEAGGNAAVWIEDPRDINQAAERVIEALRDDPAKKQSRQEAGFRNACRFSYRNMIAQYLELYTSILGQ
ncbi:MAG: glycosyltransferase family 4 protein [Verrucomicrobia bacterium]|nr:glycosyltransferase family 4 protein [Verrucomicrobiota bacterium]